MSASRASSASPTPFKRARSMSRKSLSVSGGSPVGTPVLSLFDADEVRVERLATVVELDLEVGEFHLEVLADPLGLVRRRVVADEDGHDLAAVVDELAQERAHRVGRRARGRDHTVT